MPNATLRPAQRPEKTPPPSNSVFVDSTRSPAPPIMVGTACLNACITFLAASRVASSSPGAKSGNDHGPIRPAQAASHFSRSPGKACDHAEKRSCHSLSSSVPRSTRFMWADTSSGT